MPVKKSPMSFTVEGTGYFPVDMLRYDMCWPATGDDGIKLAATMFRRDLKDQTPRRVTLMTNAQDRPTIGRWESFDWRVVQ